MHGYCLSSHLLRCSACRAFILDSDAHCWQCGRQRSAYRAFQATALTGQWVGSLLLLGLLAAGLHYGLKIRIDREEEDYFLHAQREQESELRQAEILRQELNRQRRANEPWDKWINERPRR